VRDDFRIGLRVARQDARESVAAIGRRLGRGRSSPAAGGVFGVTESPFASYTTSPACNSCTAEDVGRFSETSSGARASCGALTVSAAVGGIEGLWVAAPCTAALPLNGV
jgi:hypothetical protein